MNFPLTDLGTTLFERGESPGGRGRVPRPSRVPQTRIQIAAGKSHCDPLRLKETDRDRSRFHAHFYAPFTAMTETRTQCSHFRSTNPSHLVPRNLTTDRSSSRRRLSESRKLVPGGNAHPRPHSFRHRAAISHFNSKLDPQSIAEEQTFARARDASGKSLHTVNRPSRSRDPHFNGSIGALSRTVASTKYAHDRRRCRRTHAKIHARCFRQIRNRSSMGLVIRFARFAAER